MKLLRAVACQAWRGIAWSTVFALGLQSACAATGASASDARVAPLESYRVSPTPEWVVPVPAVSPALAPGLDPQGYARLDLLSDIQIRLGGRGATTYRHTRQIALRQAALAEVARLQIRFNPVRQALSLHGAWVVRDGLRMDQLAYAQIEVTADSGVAPNRGHGMQTLRLQLPAVHVGDVVELAYSLNDAEPEFGRRFATLLPLGSSVPLSQLHVRIESPAERKLHAKVLAADLKPETLGEDGVQVLRVSRQHVAPTFVEANVPPSVPVQPALHVSEWQDWAEVDAWAQRLFPRVVAGGKVAELAAKIRARSGAPDQAAADALRFVQDDIEVLATPLADDVYAPATPAQTLASRRGNRYDRVHLLVNLLTALGLDAQPALVSMQLRDGLDAYLPAHDRFDHAVVRLRLGDQVYDLDAMNGQQGMSLTKLGYLNYGRALIIGSGMAPQASRPPASHVSESSVLLDWDLSRPERPSRLLMRVQARGELAERWRFDLARERRLQGAQIFVDALREQHPDLRLLEGPSYSDDRLANVLEMTLRYEHPGPAKYEAVHQRMLLAAHSIDGMLGLAQDATRDRRHPFMLPAQRAFEHRFVVRGPAPLLGGVVPVQQLQTPHFALLAHAEAAGQTFSYSVRLEWRGDVVPLSDIPAFRDQLGEARRKSGYNYMVPLYDGLALSSRDSEVRARMVEYEPTDALWRQLMQFEAMRMACSNALTRVSTSSPLAGSLLADRSRVNLLLGATDSALADAQAAVAIAPNDEAARAAVVAALLGLGRFEEALGLMGQLLSLDPSARLSHSYDASMGLKRFADAEQFARQHVQRASGEERQYALLRLYASSEAAKAGTGRASLLAQLRPTDLDGWAGFLLRFVQGELGAETLLERARDVPDLARVRLAEAYYYLGLTALQGGREAEARPWFERVLSTKALYFREYSLARRALAG